MLWQFQFLSFRRLSTFNITDFPETPGGGGVLPYMGYVAMVKGMVFQPLWS